MEKNFDQPKTDLRTYMKHVKIRNGVLDDYITGCLLHYPYFKKHRVIEVNLSKQQPPDANPKAIQKNIFTENLEGARNTCF